MKSASVRVASLRPQLGVQRIPQRISKQVEAEHSEADGKSGKDRHPWRTLGILLGAPTQHKTPRRRRLLHTEAEVRQRGFDQDRLADRCRDDDELGSHAVGNHVP